jgi:hypothetical protein
MKYLNSIIVVLLLSANLAAQESIALNNPIDASPGVGSFRLGDFHLSIIRKTVELVFYEIDSNGDFVPEGKNVACNWTEADGSVRMLRQLNTANLSANSLQRRAIVAAQAKGCIGLGAIIGVPRRPGPP